MIWGLLDTGDSWWKVIQHQAFFGTPPPHFLTITSTGPGELKFSLHGNSLLVLKHGELSYGLPNPIWTGPISRWLEKSRDRLQDQVLRTLGITQCRVEDYKGECPSTLYDQFLARLLFNIQSHGYGGTIILIPEKIISDDEVLLELIDFKYQTEFDYAWHFLNNFLVIDHDYETLYSQLNQSEALLLENVQRSRSLSTESAEVYEELQDIAKSIASLTRVDGAVVISTQFRVLGFGGEILTNASSLSHVIHESENQKLIPIEDFGTRHRSAFRFCFNLEDSVAFIASSDGGVKAAKREGDNLLYWSDINEGAVGL